jgi:hypothetical protein
MSLLFLNYRSAVKYESNLKHPNYRPNNNESLLSSADGLDSEFKDSAEDVREIDAEERKVLYGDTAGDRSELAVLQFSAQPSAHAKSVRLGWWL